MKAVTSAVLALAFASTSFAALGCGNDDLEEGDVQEGWRATNLAIASSQAQIVAEVDTDGNVVASASCPSGGSVTFDGAYGGAEDFVLEVAFDQCKAGGITTSGELSYTASIDVSAGEGESSSRVELSYSGHLTWSGDVSGECTIDATIKVNSSVSGGMGTASVEARGTMCGYSADAVAGVSY